MNGTNVKPKAKKLLKENTRETPGYWSEQSFLFMSQKI
jgi:hypothetical protein